jgi:hypothetical protein
VRGGEGVAGRKIIEDECMEMKMGVRVRGVVVSDEEQMR